MDNFVFSRGKLTDFLACQRRFQLRYLQHIPWPSVPLDAETEAQVERGRQFHQLIERHFLGLPIHVEDKTVRFWWTQFQKHAPSFPEGDFLPELTLTVPIGGHVLTGRFDLLVLGRGANGRYHAHIYDWKTGQAQPESRLREDWQTRLYLAMLAESGNALHEKLNTDKSELLSSDNIADSIAITYWYVTEPDTPRTIHYSTQWHTQNWADITHLITQITQHPEIWPLTDDWAQCRYCAYQSFCERQETAAMPPSLPDEEPDLFPDWQLEPEHP